jgi:putative addiction module component (TIGR02574 family)
MDLKSVLAEVHRWPVEDRLRLIEEVSHGLANDGLDLALTEDLKSILDQRLAALDADPKNVFTWDEITAHVRRSR